MYKQKYLKYKNKYKNLKIQIAGNRPIITNTLLNIKIKNFYDIIKTNDLYKQIYNKFLYLPLKNNIQIVLNYYPHYFCEKESDYCMVNINDIAKYGNIFNVIESDANREIYYYRPMTHLHTMLNKNYISYNTINGIKILNTNLIPKLYWDKYIICPTLDPVHTNHILIISKDIIRAHKFYFPDDKINLFSDMINFSNLTGQYIYNSIELGSISEIVHYHTSDEIPPLDNITEINKTNLPLLSLSIIKIYKINNNKCYNSYYIEINDNINKDTLIKILNLISNTLYQSRYINEHKYMSQIFVCPKKYNFHRIVITFRKIEKKLCIPNNGIYSEEYYNQLFGKNIELCYGKYQGYTDKLRYNILGYEPVKLNYTPHEKNTENIDELNNNNGYNIVDSCLNEYSNKLNEYCKNIFNFNQKFEDLLLSKLGSMDIVNKNTPSPYIDVYDRIISHIDEIITNDELQNILPYNIYDKIDTNFNIKDTIPIKNIFLNNNIYSVLFFKKTNFYDYKKYLKMSEMLYSISKLFTLKIHGLGQSTDTYNIYYKFIKTDIKSFLQYEDKAYKGSLKNYSDVFFLLLLYQLYKIYYTYGYVYTNISADYIVIANNLLNHDYLKIELDFKLNKKILINYKDGKYNFYGNIPFLINVHQLEQQKDDTKFKESLQQLKNIFKESLIKDKLNLDLKKSCSENIYDFIDNIGNDYLNENNMSKDNLYISKINKSIIDEASLKIKSDYTALYDTILSKEKNFKVYLQKYNTVNIPKNTKFLSATSFNLQNFEKRDIAYMLEYNWDYRGKNTNWFVSNFQLDTLLNDDKFKNQYIDYQKIQFKGLDAANADFYIKHPIKFSRHLIFNSNKDIKLLVLDFDGNKRLSTQLHILYILYEIEEFNFVINNEESHVRLNELLKKYNIVSLDIYITFVLNVLIENNKLDIDGFIGMDWIDKKSDCIKSSNTIEYVLLKPSYLKLIGLYYYDYYDNDIKLFFSDKDWSKYYMDRIKKYKKIYEKKNCANPDKKPNFEIDIFDYKLIRQKYIKYLKLIVDDDYILTLNDFFNSDKIYKSYSLF